MWIRSFIPSLWRRLLTDLGLQRSVDTMRAYQFDAELDRNLEALSRREQRPKEDILADLIAMGLAQHQAAEAYVQRWRGLSPREQEIAALTCLDFTNRQIAARLRISPETVKTHVRNILAKFGLHGKEELRVALEGWDFSAWITPRRDG